MVRHLPLVPLLVVATVMTSCGRGAGTEPPGMAHHAVILLQRADYAALANLLYEPASYGQAELARARRALTEVLTYLGGEFGPPADPRRADPRIVFYKLSIAGADIPYWKSLANFGIDHVLTYQVHFGKVGSGVLAFTFIRTEDGWQVRSIEFGLVPGEPEARDAMLRIGRGFLNHVSHLDEATITRLLDEMFPQFPAAKPAERSA